MSSREVVSDFLEPKTTEGRDPNAAEWGCGMTDRETVAVKDAEGNLRWFPVADAEHWPPTTLDAGDL